MSLEGNSNFDIFEDLFGGSDEESSATINSDYTPSPISDSGCGGSPQSSLSSSSINSPDKGIQWEDDFWGSILDNIPDSELTDISDEQSTLNISLPSDRLFADSLEWKTDDVALNNENFLQSDLPLDDDWTCEMDLTSSATQATIVTPVSVVSRCTPTSSLVSSVTPTVSNLPKPMNFKSTIVQSSNKSILLKPMTLVKQHENLKVQPHTVSHIKIGKNIFAIIKDSHVNKNYKDITSLSNNVNMTSHGSTKHLQEHDYLEDEYVDVCGTTGVSKGVGPNLVLTDEEKKLLEIENVTIPEGVTLTKDEEKVLKKVRRKIKNKQSAMESRRRRKEYIENLEKRVKHCTDVNSGLKKKVDILSEENKSLLQQLKQLQSLVATSVQQSRTAQTGTCLAVLLLSFALFFLPFNPMMNKANGDAPSTETPKNIFRSRVLLSTNDMMEQEYLEHGADEVNVLKNSHGHANDIPDHIVNNSLIFEDEVRSKIEKLLTSENGEMLRSKLENLMNMYEKPADATFDENHGQHGINIIELDHLEKRKQSNQR